MTMNNYIVFLRVSHKKDLTIIIIIITTISSSSSSSSNILLLLLIIIIIMIMIIMIIIIIVIITRIFIIIIGRGCVGRCSLSLNNTTHGHSHLHLVQQLFIWLNVNNRKHTNIIHVNTCSMQICNRPNLLSGIAFKGD